jgi:GMP synthase (glutamine-hydrolysing)
MQEKIFILDFGSQYTQLIARRVRELNIYCEIHPFNKIPKLTKDLKGVILSGSPHSVREDCPPIPVLEGIKGVFSFTWHLLWSTTSCLSFWGRGTSL